MIQTWFEWHKFTTAGTYFWLVSRTHAIQRLIKLQSIKPTTRTVPVHSCPSFIFLWLSLIHPRICNTNNLKQMRTTSCQFKISNYHINLNHDPVGKMTAFTIFNFQGKKTNTAYVSLCAIPQHFRLWIMKKISSHIWINVVSTYLISH
jgi:hypothetical protein